MNCFTRSPPLDDLGCLVVALISLVIVVVMLRASWVFGHKGTWGFLSRSYADFRRSADSEGRRAVIYLRSGRSWHQWSIWRVVFDKDALLFLTPMWIRWLIPSLRIPYKEIAIGETIRPWLAQYVVLHFAASSECLAISKKLNSELTRRIDECNS
jgi:hypothetical protein